MRHIVAIPALLLPALGLLAALSCANPAAAQATAPATDTAQPATPALPVPAKTGSPQLVVASVRLDGGWRASKLIGASVYDDQNQKVGDVDDLIVAGQDKIAVAVVSVGGFLGIGSKLVAVPYEQLRYDPSGKDARVVMPGATKDSLNTMPNFTYSGG